LIHNTDGITLSPAFYINPSIERNHLALAINELDSTCDVRMALETYREYGLTAAEAKHIVTSVHDVTSSWRSEAGYLRIPRAEQESMAAAFPQ